MLILQEGGISTSVLLFMYMCSTGAKNLERGNPYPPPPEYYANRTQAKKIITILILMPLSGKGHHTLH